MHESRQATGSEFGPAQNQNHDVEESIIPVYNCQVMTYMETIDRYRKPSALGPSISGG
jgi:hypothetical protein